MIDYELSQHAQVAIEERDIQLAWLEQILDQPARVVEDAQDPTQAAIGPIAAKDDRILRVIYSDHVEPIRIITAYFDRTLRNKL